MDKIELVYYLGVIGLISAVITIMIYKFREYEEINIKDNIIMIIIYIILLIFSIILWRLVFNFFFGIADILNQENETWKNLLRE